MDCTGCGSCCTDQRIPLNPLERGTTLREEMDGEGNLAKVDGRCIRLDPQTRRCRDYDNRPQICRDFKSGCGRCVLMRAFAVRHLGGIGDTPMPAWIKPGSFQRFSDSLSIEKDHRGNVITIRHKHADPDLPTKVALERANAELPSQGF